MPAISLVVAGLGTVIPGPATAAPTTAAASAVPLPQLHNISALTDSRASELAGEALSGLGFAPGAPDGPQPADRVVVSNTYVAWIDETGFYGKLNGLWWLSPTVSGDRSFTQRADDGRPVNQLIVGENGDGAWPIGIRGAEHIEVPNGTPEPHHDLSCVTSWCGQYAHDEAGAYSDPLIPWWRVCDPGTPGYLDHLAPIEVSITPTSVRLVYEGRLVKVADSAFPYTDTTGCRKDWLFPDGIRRPVHLRVGYELTADDPWIDRLQRIHNPDGNPPFESPFSVIGGFEVTTWPNARADKVVTRYVRPETNDVWDQWYNRTLTAGTWNTGFTEVLGLRDIVIAWMGQPVSFSSTPAFENAKSLRLSHLGPKDNKDTAFCMCLIHNTIELGGGLLHSASTSPDPGGAALPIAGGETSIEARRRLETAPATVIPDVPVWVPPSTPAPTTSAPTTVVTKAPAGSSGAPFAGYVADRSAQPAAVAVPRFTG